MKIDLHRISKLAVFNALDRNPPYHITWPSEVTARFSTSGPDAQVYVVEFEADVEDAITKIEFYNASHPTISYGVTGTGNPIKIFETVIHAAFQFHENNIEEPFAHRFYFTASHVEIFESEPGKFDKRPTKRAELYRRLIRRLLPDWKLGENNSKHLTSFKLTSPEFEDLRKSLGEID